MEPKIFISYRRDDTDASSGRLYDTMIYRYDKKNIFKDIDSILLGSNFKKTIESKIHECNIVLAIIGKNFTKLTGDKGVPRIFNMKDFVNVELSTAIKAGKTVIPVLVDNAVIPKASELPKNLHKLPYLNGIKIKHDSWHRDTEKLFREISKIIDAIEIKEEAEKKGKEQEEEDRLRIEAEKEMEKQEEERTKLENENKRKQEELKQEKKVEYKSTKQARKKQKQNTFYILISIVSVFVVIILIWQPWQRNKPINDSSTMDDVTVEEFIIPGNKISWLNDKEGYFIEERDGHSYHVVRIGNQIWMTTNLAFKPDSGNYWAYNNEQNNISKYGYLYDWETAQNICPQGWRLPSKKDFEILLANFGKSEEEEFSALLQGGSSGFDALFGGLRYSGITTSEGSFNDLGQDAFFWSSSSDAYTDAWGLSISKAVGDAQHIKENNNKASLYPWDRNMGFSVRCISDSLNYAYPDH